MEILKAELKTHNLDTIGPIEVLKERLKQYKKFHSIKQPTTITSSDKNKKKRRRKAKTDTTSTEQSEQADELMDVESGVEIEYEAQQLNLEEYPEFQEIISKFNSKGISKPEIEQAQNQSSSDEESSDDEPDKLTRSQKRKNRLSVAELKTRVKNPDLVEWVDVTAEDPMLLLQLKQTRNTIPVPDHWQMKKGYLQGKRGMVKPPFELPEYIKATGIMQTRQSTAKSMVGKARERYHPKLGKIDLDYQKLHDAFFKYQTRPVFSNHGDLYHEGKEFETRLRQKRPGIISEELNLALNIPEGAPPPWLISMQRFLS